MSIKIQIITTLENNFEVSQEINVELLCDLATLF